MVHESIVVFVRIRLDCSTASALEDRRRRSARAIIGSTSWWRNRTSINGPGCLHWRGCIHWSTAVWRCVISQEDVNVILGTAKDWRPIVGAEDLDDFRDFPVGLHSRRNGPLVFAVDHIAFDRCHSTNE